MAHTTLNDSAYKLLKEEFVSGFNGTTLTDIAVVVSSAPIAVFLRHLLCVLLLSPSTSPSWLKLLIDFVTLKIPVFLCFTAFGDSTSEAVTTLTLIAVSLVIVMHKMTETYIQRTVTSTDNIANTVMAGRRPFLTHFRAYVLVATAICILAVDFHIFPRKFCKTETYGTGLMDVGVGAFVVSNGIVSPEARAKSHSKRWGGVMQTVKTSIKQVSRAVLSCLPLLILGVARFLSVKAADYQEHVSEYGVHWNFFFTLAAVKILSTVLLCVFPGSWSWLVAVLVASGYQYLLQQPSILGYILHGADGKGSRQGWIEANREGIFSVLGYLALYFAAVQLGRFLLQPRVRLKEWVRCFFILVCLDGLCWIALYYCEVHFGAISRRLANLSFVIWMLAYNLQLIPMFLMIELIQTALQESGMLPSWSHSHKDKQVAHKFCLLEAINRNGLFYFLLANLLTGLVNQAMDTFFALPAQSYTVLVVYLFLLSCVAAFMHSRNITLRFW